MHPSVRTLSKIFVEEMMSKKTWDELDPLGLERSHAEAEDRLHDCYLKLEQEEERKEDTEDESRDNA